MSRGGRRGAVCFICNVWRLLFMPFWDIIKSLVLRYNFYPHERGSIFSTHRGGWGGVDWCWFLLREYRRWGHRNWWCVLMLASKVNLSFEGIWTKTGRLGFLMYSLDDTDYTNSLNNVEYGLKQNAVSWVFTSTVSLQFTIYSLVC